jgi:ABC-type oligopeptide transport system substrate-binding subunit
MRTKAKHGAPLRLLPLLALVVSCCALAADPAKILRVASPDIETLDPQQFSDNPSFEVLIAIFEPLYEWDYLRSPPNCCSFTASSRSAST